MGPFAPGMQPDDELAVCGPCGQPRYFRVAVDVTHIAGETDRGYGILFWDTEQELSMYEISPLYLVTLATRYDRATRLFYLLNPNIDQILTGLVKPGKATNRLELVVEPSGTSNANVYFKINDKTAFLLYNKPAIAGHVGLAVEYHSVQVGFDNFEFETLGP